MSARTKTTRVPFVIEGAFITQIARQWVLEGEPAKAWRFLADNLKGSSNGSSGQDAARMILEGTHELIGDSSTTVELVPSTGAHDVEKYLDGVKWLYAGCVKFERKWYQPRAVVTCYGIEDAKWATPGLEDIRGDKAKFSKRRAGFYAGRGEIVELVDVDVDLTGHGFTTRHKMCVIFTPCGEPPAWLEPANDLQTAVDAFTSVRSLKCVGAEVEASYAKIAEVIVDDIEHNERLTRLKLEAELLDAANAADDEAEAAHHARLREVIIRQAGDDLIELKTLSEKTLLVPRAPFIWWALDGRLAEKPDNLPEWALISPSGLKMPCDNRYHTDWCIGAGINPRDAYEDDINKPAWELAFKLQCLHMGIDVGDE